MLWRALSYACVASFYVAIAAFFFEIIRGIFTGESPASIHGLEKRLTRDPINLPRGGGIASLVFLPIFFAGILILHGSVQLAIDSFPLWSNPVELIVGSFAILVVVSFGLLLGGFGFYFLVHRRTVNVAIRGRRVTAWSRLLLRYKMESHDLAEFDSIVICETYVRGARHTSRYAYPVRFEGPGVSVDLVSTSWSDHEQAKRVAEQLASRTGLRVVDRVPGGAAQPGETT